MSREFTPMIRVFERMVINMRNPNQNLEYRMNSKGRMVVVEKYDPETMKLFTLTPDMEPTEEQLEMLKKLVKSLCFMMMIVLN